VTVLQPTELASDPAHWQKRANEIRQLAETIAEPNTREVFLKLAAEYDKLAQRAASRAHKPKSSGTAA
jgi:hypothetical protein